MKKKEASIINIKQTSSKPAVLDEIENESPSIDTENTDNNNDEEIQLEACTRKFGLVGNANEAHNDENIYQSEIITQKDSLNDYSDEETVRHITKKGA